VGSLDLEDRPFRASQAKTEKTKNVMTVVDTACIEEKKEGKRETSAAGN
jgi:hypothetical protein